MLVFKFGGASVKDAKGVKNLCKIISQFQQNIVVVISAFGKTTNMLEELMVVFENTDKEEFDDKYAHVKNYHYGIVRELFKEYAHPVYSELDSLFKNLYDNLNTDSWINYDQKYDQTVSFGELMSTMIVSYYLNHCGLKNQWIDIRKVLITDNQYRDAKVLFELSEKSAQETFKFENEKLYLTQGFIGGTKDNITTTLGREGSDYTAALIANFMNAEKVIIWKDVPGIMNADPRQFTDCVKLDSLSYQETVELAYFGAKVIHPNTLKPLHNKNIPLHVKSFLTHNAEGTEIRQVDKYACEIPIYIVKSKQILISLLPKDFSFILEDKLLKIYEYFQKQRIKINLMQNSAVSFSVCVDGKNYNKVFELITQLKNDFRVLYNENLDLITIRHYNQESIDRILNQKEVLLEQRSRTTAQFIVKSSDQKN